MSLLTEYVSYADAQTQFDRARLWDLFDGDRERFNIAHECVDRHARAGAGIALQIAHADGRDEVVDFATLARRSAQMAHFLQARGIGHGDRVAVILEPSLAYYAALFGILRLGAVAVPLFTLFGPDGIRLRVADCAPRLILAAPEKAADATGIGAEVVVTDAALLAGLDTFPGEFEPATAGDDLAVLQYTSGTTRQLPAAVRHSHRSIVTLMTAALYGTGIRPGDRFFCPSSPAWGHGLWHGTLAPLALGVPTGTFSGRFDPVRLLHALSDFGITNISAAATHYRMMRTSGAAPDFSYAVEKASFTGEPIDGETGAFIEQTFGTRVCSMYGTPEIGVILACYPGAPDFPARAGSLGKPLPGIEVSVHRPDGTDAAAGEVGELMLHRSGDWVSTKDRGWIDEDGYFHHAGRADDVIISAGWTMGAVEIEDAILRHADVLAAAVIGVPDETRGQVVKAFIVARDGGRPGLDTEIQDFVRARLSRHEYPRQIEFVDSLPTTPAGKINRRALREQNGLRVAAGQH